MAFRLAQFALLTAVLAATAQAAVQQHVKGADFHCIGRRAHSLEYEIVGNPNDGSSLAEVSSAQINMRPTPHRDDDCAPSVKPERLGEIANGSKALCYGANAAPSCDAAQAPLPIKEDLDCENCYVGAKASLFYSLNYSIPDVYSVKVGFEDMHLKGAVVAHAHPHLSKQVAEGTLVLKDGQFATVIDQVVGCPVCVRVKVSVAVPTELKYSLTLSTDLDATVGAEVDADLGNHYLSWDHQEGWKWASTEKSLKVTPILSEKTPKAQADLQLDLGSSVQVDIDEVMWYHMNMAAPMPFTFTLEDDAPSASKAVELCADGTAGFKMSHEADLHVTLFGTEHEIHHWGPLNGFSKTADLHKCVDVPITAEPAGQDVLVV